MKTGSKCTVCGKQKNELRKRISKCLPGVQMFLCKECMDAKREPRGYIILAGRRDGIESIQFWIKPQRYLGEPITVRELT